MNPRARRFGWLVWSGLLLVVATLFLAYLLASAKRALLGKPLPIYGQVANFSLTNQNGQAISLADLRGHVWVADIIFTRCPGPCAKMTRQMKELQDSLPSGNQAKLVTLTTDPDYDTPSVLKERAQTLNADPNRWM